MILRFVLDLTDEEIGRLMGMSRSAVQRHRTSTLKDLRIKLMAFMPGGRLNADEAIQLQGQEALCLISVIDAARAGNAEAVERVLAAL